MVLDSVIFTLGNFELSESDTIRVVDFILTELFVVIIFSVIVSKRNFFMEF